MTECPHRTVYFVQRGKYDNRTGQPETRKSTWLCGWCETEFMPVPLENQSSQTASENSSTPSETDKD